MKKIVIILIVGLYFGSIYLVYTFGRAYDDFVKTAYVEKIECNTLTDGYGYEIGCFFQEDEDEDGNPIQVKCFENVFIPGDDDANTYHIDCLVIPATADNKNVTFTYTAKPSKFFIDEEAKTITFFKACSVKITISSTDGNNISETFWIELD